MTVSTLVRRLKVRSSYLIGREDTDTCVCADAELTVATIVLGRILPRSTA